MAYSKHTWVTGETITATKLNNIENGLEQASADSAQAVEELDSKANIDGAYEDMTVGNAEQLVSTQYSEDQEPYIFRTAGGSADIGNRETDTIVGGSIAWNQMVQNGNFASTSGWEGIAGTITASNNVLTYTPTGSGFYQIYHAISVPANHVALIMAYAKFTKASTNARVFLAGESSGASSALSIPANTKTLLSGIGKNSINMTRVYIRFGVDSQEAFESTDIVTVENVMVFDLTQMFGTAVADAIYAKEQASAGAGVAYFKSLFPKDYYEYNAGGMEHVNASEHVTVGFNQWDEEWEVGDISATTGQNVSGSTTRSKNYIPVVQGQSYYINPSSIARVCAYDSEKNFISTLSFPSGICAIPYGVAFIRFRTNAAYGTTYKNDICINLSWSGYRNGEYEPYVKHSYPLDSSLVLRGIPKADANGNLYYDGDTYESDGTVTRKYGIVDLGTLTWTYISSSVLTVGGYFSANVSNRLPGNIYGHMICEKYLIASVTGASNQPADSDKLIFTTNSANVTHIYIIDSAYTDATEFKASLDGVYLVYELASPTTEQAETYTNPQIVDDFGIEEYIDYAYSQGDRDVAIPVGHVTQYMQNLRDKLQHLPDLADSDGYYVIQQTSNDMSLVHFRIPQAPTTDGTYVLKATVSGGTPTYTWEAE